MLFSIYLGQKQPCTVFAYKVLEPLLQLGPAQWSNENYRKMQIESLKAPFSNIELVSKLTKNEILSTKKLPENTWYLCQHWNANYTSGHTYFYFVNGDTHIIVDSSDNKVAGVRTSSGQMPVTAPNFRAVKVR